MRGRFAVYVQGIGLASLAFLSFLFFLYALFLREPLAGFATTSLLTLMFGAVFLRLGVATAEPTRREAIIGVLLLWLLLPLFGSLPFSVTGYFSPVDALFESMSGFTTTGATVLQDFSSFPASLFLWRAILQWIGGIGIIVIFIAVFPHIAIAGRQLFFAEMPGPTEERFTPRLRHTARAVLVVYLGWSILCGVAYVLAGMTPYEAVLHSFTTLASGGFSSHPQSLAGYSSTVNWIAVLFMTLAGISFTLQYQFLMGRSFAIIRDREFRSYLLIIFSAAALLTLSLQEIYPVGEAFRHSIFQSLTIVTTTGYASADFAVWPIQAQAILLSLMFVGGSAGSTAGGVKVARWLIVLAATRVELKRALHPRMVSPVTIGNRVVSDDIIRAVLAFIVLYLLFFAFTTLMLAWLEGEFVLAFSAAIACIGNVGPGLAAVGPMLSYAELHPASKLLLTFGMYAGRLELVVVFVLINRDFWHLPQRR